jgi:hypothetical protein
MGGGKHGGFNIHPRTIDFYVGENKQVLPGKYKKWIGVSRREHLLNGVSNYKLKNAIDKLYRPGSFIGDGGTASVLKFEKRTGEHVSRSPQGHYIKAVETVRYIKNRILTENLSNKDRKTANKVLRNLQKAILEWEGKI